MTAVDVISHNAEAWDNQVKNANQWTVPVSREEIDAARAGLFSILLTAKKPVPRDWFPKRLAGTKILCLASGGGQQAPILSATGAQVTVFDNSLAQLTQDRLVAQRENLPLKVVRGDMRDLHAFADGAFDLVFCPVSVTYIPEVQSVFDEVYRVLKKGGSFLFGATNPFVYIFDGPDWDQNRFTVSNQLPFCSLDELTPEQVSRVLREKETIQYSHTLERLIGGQTAAGFSITGFYEDVDDDLICRYAAKYFATRAVK
ncbi:MAG: class I SAM-dependent methyltransferase [Oscillospiraceae bacterium]|nr:class I SAM-dependent methyltransferase [Oscillospiraceae bacterium]